MTTEEKMVVGLGSDLVRPRSGREWDSIYILCRQLFETNEGDTYGLFPIEYWLRTYPLEVVLYALLESHSKFNRTKPTMSPRQIANFASSVMERKFSDDQRKRRECAMSDKAEERARKAQEGQ